jgi:hypothetical protein
MEVLEFLLAAGVNMRAGSEFNRPPLLLMAEQGNWEACRWLVEHGAAGHDRRAEELGVFCETLGEALVVEEVCEQYAEEEENEEDEEEEKESAELGAAEGSEEGGWEGGRSQGEFNTAPCDLGRDMLSLYDMSSATSQGASCRRDGRRGRRAARHASHSNGGKINGNLGDDVCVGAGASIPQRGRDATRMRYHDSDEISEDASEEDWDEGDDAGKVGIMVAAGEETLYAHRAILAARCPYFCVALCGSLKVVVRETTETTEMAAGETGLGGYGSVGGGGGASARPILDLSHATPQVADALLRFLHTGMLCDRARTWCRDGATKGDDMCGGDGGDGGEEEEGDDDASEADDDSGGVPEGPSLTAQLLCLAHELLLPTLEALCEVELCRCVKDQDSILAPLTALAATYRLDRLGAVCHSFAFASHRGATTLRDVRRNMPGDSLLSGELLSATNATSRNTTRRGSTHAVVADTAEAEWATPSLSGAIARWATEVKTAALAKWEEDFARVANTGPLCPVGEGGTDGGSTRGGDTVDRGVVESFDVTLTAAGGVVFGAHRCVLSTRSAYFRAAFRHRLHGTGVGGGGGGDQGDTLVDNFDLPHAQPLTIQNLLGFLYAGRVPSPHEQPQPHSYVPPPDSRIRTRSSSSIECVVHFCSEIIECVDLLCLAHELMLHRLAHCCESELINLVEDQEDLHTDTSDVDRNGRSQDCCRDRCRRSGRRCRANRGARRPSRVPRDKNDEANLPERILPLLDVAVHFSLRRLAFCCRKALAGHLPALVDRVMISKLENEYTCESDGESDEEKDRGDQGGDERAGEGRDRAGNGDGHDGGVAMVGGGEGGGGDAEGAVEERRSRRRQRLEGRCIKRLLLRSMVCELSASYIGNGGHRDGKEMARLSAEGRASAESARRERIAGGERW